MSLPRAKKVIIDVRLDKLNVKIVLGESIESGHSQEQRNVV